MMRFLGKSLRKVTAVMVTVAILASLMLSSLPTAEAYVPSGWHAGTAMGQVASDAAFAFDGQNGVYVCGGYTNLTFDPTSDVMYYDLTTGETTLLANITVPVRGSAGAYYGSHVYVFGGRDVDLNDRNLNQIYSVDTDTWSTGAAMPSALYSPRAAVDENGLIYIVGGYQGGTSTNNCYVYHPATDTWDSMAVLPVATHKGALVHHNGYLYYIGGTTGTSAGATNNVYRYSISGNSWAMVADMPIATTGLCAVVGPDGFIYTMGGADTFYLDNPGSTRAFYYNPFENTWSSASYLNREVIWGGAAMTPGGLIYILGGNGGTSGAVTGAVSYHRVMTISASLAPSVIAPGGSTVASFSFSFTYADARGYTIMPLVYDPTDRQFAYGIMSIAMAVDNSFSLVVPVADGAMVGQYTLTYQAFTVSYVTGSWELAVPGLVFEVEGVPFSQQLADLQAQLSAAQAEIAALRSQLSDTNDLIDTQAAAMIAQLEALNAALQSQIDALNATMIEDQAETSQSISDLQDQVAALQTELDAMKAQSTKLQTSVDTKADAMLSYLTIVLLVVVVLLMVLLLVRGQRKT